MVLLLDLYDQILRPLQTYPCLIQKLLDMHCARIMPEFAINVDNRLTGKDLYISKYLLLVSFYPCS